jgi:dipeptidyl aminopeptidase/acylaminoacyl peptidase
VRAALLAVVALLTAAAVAADAAPAVLRPVRALAAEAAPPAETQDSAQDTAQDTAVLVRSGDDVLAGTLSRPSGPGPFPAVVLISGSGAQDRDAAVDGYRPFRLLADALTAAGFAVLRTDDRGVGGSAGSYDGSSYDDLASDVLAEVAYLANRPDVDPARIGLLGHSEGGYLAPLAVSRSQDMVAFVVLLAAPAVPGADLVADRSDTDDGDAGPRRRSFLDYDPRPALGSLPVPVLAVYGDRDVQVPPDQSVPVLTALLAGKPDATIDVLPGLDHSLRPVDGGYDDAYDTAIAPGALDLVTGWMKEHCGG